MPHHPWAMCPLDAKACLLDELLPQLVDGTAGNQPALHEDAHVVAYLLDLVQLVRGNQDGFAIMLGQLANEDHQFPHAFRIDAVGRFVYDEHVRILHQDIRNAQPLAPALAGRSCGPSCADFRGLSDQDKSPRCRAGIPQSA